MLARSAQLELYSTPNVNLARSQMQLDNQSARSVPKADMQKQKVRMNARLVKPVVFRALWVLPHAKIVHILLLCLMKDS